ncbi:unnamed protein product [Boreogadus saida]
MEVVKQIARVVWTAVVFPVSLSQVETPEPADQANARMCLLVTLLHKETLVPTPQLGVHIYYPSRGRCDPDGTLGHAGEEERGHGVQMDTVD